ncbi:MAG: hypothetical protein M1838_004316 [Thelocarpon superellum]|nr:MAG: hypothetical protein M1838_004316 [Thelocarpon superellum]
MTSTPLAGPALPEKPAEDLISTSTTRVPEVATSSSSLEMSRLEQTPGPSAASLGAVRIPEAGLGSVDLPSTTAVAPSTASEPVAPSSAPPPLIVEDETTAIGPSTGEVAVVEPDHPGATMMITLLLTSGARHPYKIDRKYLRKRNVNAVENDPFNLSVYTLKELIWREWRDEWEPRPSSPSSIRLIHFGRLLDDKAPLKECRLNADTPNVIHMTVRPQEVVDEEDAKTAKQELGRDRDGNERTPGCRCVIL